jgi:hypothetical protein
MYNSQVLAARTDQHQGSCRSCDIYRSLQSPSLHPQPLPYGESHHFLTFSSSLSFSRPRLTLTYPTPRSHWVFDLGIFSPCWNFRGIPIPLLPSPYAAVCLACNSTVCWSRFPRFNWLLRVNPLTSTAGCAGAATAGAVVTPGARAVSAAAGSAADWLFRPPRLTDELSSTGAGAAGAAAGRCVAAGRGWSWTKEEEASMVGRGWRAAGWLATPGRGCRDTELATGRGATATGAVAGIMSEFVSSKGVVSTYQQLRG